MGNKAFTISINELGVSQLYLSQDKIKNISLWPDPHKANYEPLPVKDFMGCGKYVLTDGHTRAYKIYKSGVGDILVSIDDEIVTCDMGAKLYKEFIRWCNRFSVHSIKDLECRIISGKEYDFLWIERCDRLYNLMTALENAVITDRAYTKLRRAGEQKNLLLYGADKELACYYYEDLSGNLWLYSNGRFTVEYSVS